MVVLAVYFFNCDLHSLSDNESRNWNHDSSCTRRKRNQTFSGCRCTAVSCLFPRIPHFSCDQAALRMVQSVYPSVRHTFLTMFPSSYHHEILRSYYQWQKWRPCKRSRSKVKGHRGKISSNLTQIGRFRTVTPVWIQQWLRNDTQSLK